MGPGRTFLESVGFGKTAAAVPTAATAKATAAPKLQVNLTHIGIDRTHIAKLCPKVTGATCHPVVKKRCFTSYYPGAKPGSRTRTWGLCATKAQCLRHCL